MGSASVTCVTCRDACGALVVMCTGTGVSLLMGSRSICGLPSCVGGGVTRGGSVGRVCFVGRCTCLSAPFKVVILGLGGGRVDGTCVLGGGVGTYTMSSRGVCTTSSRKLLAKLLASGLLSIGG